MGHKFGPNFQNPHLVHTLEHGNYKLFGLSKNSLKKQNKFLSNSSQPVVDHICKMVVHNTEEAPVIKSDPVTSFGIRKLVNINQD